MRAQERGGKGEGALAREGGAEGKEARTELRFSLYGTKEVLSSRMTARPVDSSTNARCAAVAFASLR